jgi:hypothetical protein
VGGDDDDEDDDDGQDDLMQQWDEIEEDLESDEDEWAVEQRFVEAQARGGQQLDIVNVN